ncbi:MAG: Ig-like domain-containing protein [Microbacterium sp.]
MGSFDRPVRYAAGAIVAGLLVALAPSAASAAVAEYDETAEYVFDDGVKTGAAADTAADTAVFTRTYGSSVEVVTLDAGGSPISTQTLVAEEPGNSFGIDVALDEDASTLYVSQSRLGQVHVYERDTAGMWQKEVTLHAPEELPDRVGAYGANIGEAIDVSGGRLVVGVANARVDNKSNAGFAFLVDVEQDAWTALIPEDPIANSITGQQVAISGGRVALGAPQVRNGQQERIGGVYVWDVADDGPVDEPLFTSQPAGDPSVCLQTSGSGPAFGIALAFTADGLAVGSPLEIDYAGDDPDDPVMGCSNEAVAAGNTTQGAVYLFDDQLEQAGPKIVSPLGMYAFGQSVAVHDDVLVTRAFETGYVGHAFVYDLASVDREGTGDEYGRQRPEPAQDLVPANATPRFGESTWGRGLAAGPQQIVVGTDTTPGAAHVFGAVTPLALATGDLAVTYGEATTWSAEVVSGDLPEGAAVRFSVDGEVVGEQGVVDAEASIALAAAGHDAGEHELSAELVDAEGESLAAPAIAELSVSRATTETTAEVDTEARSVRARVTAEFGTVPAGQVEILRDGATVDAVPLDAAGEATWNAPSEAADETTYVVRYAGERNHAPSEIDVTVPAVPSGGSDDGSDDDGAPEGGGGDGTDAPATDQDDDATGVDGSGTDPNEPAEELKDGSDDRAVVAGPSADDADGDLAVTGADPTVPLVLGIVALLAGGAIVTATIGMRRARMTSAR